jgi:hypothetical protein
MVATVNAAGMVERSFVSTANGLCAAGMLRSLHPRYGCLVSIATVSALLQCWRGWWMCIGKGYATSVVEVEGSCFLGLLGNQT